MLEGVSDVDRAMSRIGSESERLYRLVDEMLQLARDGATDAPTEVLDLAAIATEVAADLRAASPVAASRSASLPAFTRSSGLPPASIRPGTIAVEDTPGGGATFVLSFPRHVANPAPRGPRGCGTHLP